jgi:adenosylcobinamide-GDP ribazoletransferase
MSLAKKRTYKTYKRYANRQLNLLYLALCFFTRFPMPKSMYYSPSLLNQSGRYFSLVGLILGALLCVCFVFFNVAFSINISVTLLIIVSLFMTGSFHEDGLADMADGIGGGMTVDKRLEIMKDSRIGTYGSVTIVMALLLKCLTLIEVAQAQIFIPTLLLGYTLSRAVAGSLIYDMPYVADIDASKSKPLANKQSTFELTLLIVIGALPLLLFSFTTVLMIVGVLFAFRTLYKRWLNARLGGYTGDCLGASQQISELLIYLTILACFAFINPLSGAGTELSSLL